MSYDWAACVRSALCVGSFIAFCGLVNGVAHAQDVPSDERPFSGERLVLLNTGRMLTGQVTRNGGGYLIEQPNGRIQVVAEDVKCIVKDLREAYQKQRDSIVEPTPATHIALANWCISYRLHDEARDELKRCLKADPENAEARRLLQRLTDTIRAGLSPRAEDPIAKKTAEGFLQQDVESLGGLSPDTATMFTSRIQPLLMNKCGNTSCHAAASSNTFRLTLSRGAGKGTRQNTEHNLAEVMRYIDLDDVASSQLLRASQGGHGGKGTVFVGPAGAEQARLLRSWALTVANEKQAEAQKLAKRPRLPGKGGSKYRIAQASAVAETPRETATHGSSLKRDSEDEDLTPAAVPVPPRELKVDPTDAIELAIEPEDPFDPEQFNRRFRRP